MRKFSELDRSERWEIMGATSIKGMLERASKMKVELTANDDIFARKKATFPNLIDMKRKGLIKQYTTTTYVNGMFNELFIELNDGSIISCKNEVVFKF